MTPEEIGRELRYWDWVNTKGPRAIKRRKLRDRKIRAQTGKHKPKPPLKTHCPRGHSYRLSPGGERYCPTCQVEAQRLRRQRKREETG